MINKLISEYLRANKRLVVPTFGAFIRKDEDGSIVFVSFLKKDDGVLTQLVSKAYGVSDVEAMAAIEEYALHAKQHILSSGSFVIEGLGVLKTDANGIDYLAYNTAQQVGDAVTREPAVASQPSPTITPQSSTQTQPQSTPVTSAAASVPPAPRPTATAPTTAATPLQTAQPQTPVQPVPVAPRPAAPQPTPSTVSPTAQRAATPIQPQARPVPPTPNSTINSATSRPSAQVRPVAPQRPTSRPVPPRGAAPQAKKTDTFMVIAILAALVAIAALMYGVFFTAQPKIDLNTLPAVDTTTVEQVAK